MSKMKQFDRTAARELREKINSALTKVGDELGLKIQAGGASFSEKLMTFQLECAVVGECGEVATKEAADFKRFQSRHGLSLESLGKEFTTHNGKFILLGYRPRGRSFPFVGKCVGTGKMFKFTQSEVETGFKDPS